MEGVTKYAFVDGSELWHCNTIGNLSSFQDSAGILGGTTFGLQTDSLLYVSTDQKNVHCIAKHDGSTIKLYAAEFPTPSVFCCALSPGKNK